MPLNSLTIAILASDRYSPWSTSISGKTNGSTISATASDGTALVISGSTISGTFATAGSKTITLIETLASAANSPRISAATLIVDEPAEPIFASDLFSGATGGYLYQHAPEKGGNWAGYDGGGQTRVFIGSSNDIWGDSTSGSHVLSLAPVEPDVMVEADIRQLSSVPNQLMGVIARAQTGSTSFYFAEYSKPLGAFRIGKKIDGGSSIPIVVSDPFILQNGQLYHIIFTVVGSTLTLWVDGVQISQATDTDITTSGKVGVRLGGAATSVTTGMHLDSFKASFITPLPVATEIPPTLIGPWEPQISWTSGGATLTAGSEAKAEDHILITGSQCSVQPATRNLKVEDCSKVRAVGIDMGGYELSMRAREHAAFVGIAFDGAGKPESDALATGAVSATSSQPQVLVQYCRLVNAHGTDLNYWQVGNPSLPNSAAVTKVEQISVTNPPRFRITLSEAFPEGLAPGSYSPPRRITVGGNSYQSINRPLEGYNWSYDIDNVVSATVYEGSYINLGSERWFQDNRATPAIDPVSGNVPAGTGGTAWLYRWDATKNEPIKGEHADAVQVEDDRPVTNMRVENCVTSGSYQRLGNFGGPGRPFELRNVHSFNAFSGPYDPPASKTLYIKDAQGTSTPPTGKFENVWFPMIFGRPVSGFGAYADQPPASTTAVVNGVPKLTYNAGGLWQGSIVDGTPPVDFAPADEVGTNWSGGLYRGKTPIGTGSLTGITFAPDTLAANMPEGTRVGVIDVQHTTQNEIIELEISNNNATIIKGVSAKANTNLIRRGLVVGSGGLQAGTHSFTLLARLRSNPAISVQQNFSISVTT